VQTYAIELGKDFDLPPEEMDALRAAAILHDVGKLAVPEYIISKPGKLTPGEFAKMKIHTVVGAEIVESVNFPFAVAPLVRSHHEKWDGSGYPDGLKGEEIPFGARILTAVDCLDALASDRQYRKAMPLDQAMSIIVAESGKSFDPQVVAALNKRCHELESLARSTLQQDSMKFSVDMTIDRGLAPDAGFAAESQHSHPGSALVREEIARELSILNSIAVRIGQLESIEADLSAIEPLLRELIPFDSMALYRLCGDKLQCIFAHGEAAEFLLGLSIQTGEGVSGWTVANRTPLRNGNAVTEFGIAGEMHAGFTLVAGLSIPLDSEFGTIGALTLYNHRRDAFETSHLRTLLALGSRLAYQLNLDFSGLSRTAPDPYFSDGAPGLQISRLSEVIESHTVGASPEVARLS
jgi:putative nucleotidyltransferase with HDIG domain